MMMENFHYDLNEEMIDYDLLDFDYEMNIDRFHYYVDNHLHMNFEN